MLEKKRNLNKIRTYFNDIRPYQLVVIIGILIVLISVFPVLEQMFHNLGYFFDMGNNDQIILYFSFIILILAYLIIYLYINQFFTKVYIPIVLAIGLVVLLGLLKNSMGPRYLPSSFETFVYLLVLGFILLFTFVFTAEKVGNERFIIAVLFVAAVFAIVMISFILIFLLGEAIPLIEQYGLLNFLFGLKRYMTRARIKKPSKIMILDAEKFLHIIRENRSEFVIMSYLAKVYFQR